MSTTIKLRRDTAARWASVNPVLAQGELGLETDTGKYKFGNGASTWSALSYYNQFTDADKAAIVSGGGQVNTVVAGANVTIDASDPVNPVISATGQTGAEIKVAYEGEADTNAFTDAEQTKLAGVETGADVTDSANVVSALDSAVLSDAGTPASTDQVLIKDAGTGALQTADFADFGGGGGGGITFGTAPVATNSTGTAGTMLYDATDPNYLYICTATDTWKRTTLLDW